MDTARIPLELLDDLSARLPGFSRADFLEAHTLPPPVSVRLNPAKPSAAFADAERVRWCADGRYLAQRPVFTLDPLLHAGAYYVQEASSMLLAHAVQKLLPERSGLRVLDLCAAPGGKSTLLASLLPQDAVLVSNEVIRTRVPLLAENLGRWGAPNVIITTADPARLAAVGPLFGAVVVDAPCSGSGLFRKDADAVDHWSREAVRLCADRQRRILREAWKVLQPGGVLIYSTCSFSAEEDEDILDWMADELGAESLPIPMPAEWGFAETRARGGVGYRASPERVRGEGFFLAGVRKVAGEEPRPARVRSAHNPKVFAQAEHLLRPSDWRCAPTGPDAWSAMTPAVEELCAALQPAVPMVRAGVPLGAPAAKGWVPAHDAALSTALSPDIPALAVGREDALLFLKREEMRTVVHAAGWQVVAYEGLPLGWVKALPGGRLNNYLPKASRIRMRIDGGTGTEDDS